MKYYTFKHTAKAAHKIEEFDNAFDVQKSLTGGSIYSNFNSEDIDDSIKDKGFFTTLNNYSFYDSAYCSMVVKANNLEEALKRIVEFKGGR